MNTYAQHLEDAGNYCLFADGDHMSCRAAFLDDRIEDACKECRAHCACCGEMIAFEGGRDATVSGVVLCLRCAAWCQVQGCHNQLHGEMFMVHNDGIAGQVLPVCIPCALRFQTCEREAA